MKRTLLIGIGTLCVGLGFIGIFVPLLPTTPFLLLAAACYARGSQRFYNWLITNRWFGQYIRNYREKRGIPLRAKIIAITLIWVTILFSVFFVVSFVLLKIILVAIAVGVSVYLLSIKTVHMHQDTR